LAISFQSTKDVIIQVADLRQATHFYEKVLGFRVTHRADTLVGFDTGSFVLYVEQGVDPGPVFEFLVSDMGEAKQLLLGASCQIIDEDLSMPRCYMRDPFGLMFNLSGRAPV